MITFKQYLKEGPPAWTESLSTMLFDLPREGLKDLKIPLSPAIFKRIWPESIRSKVFHLTDDEGIRKLKKMQGGKKSISAFYNMEDYIIQSGIKTEGGYVVELEGDVLAAAPDDISSQPDKTGRRWVELSWFASATRTGPKFDKVEKDLNTLITNLVKKHLTKILGKNTVISTHEYELWGAMKRHLHGDGQKLRLVIKDYFDGVEKVLKKNSEVMGNILYGYAKGKRMTDNAWDEQIVNNIKITKVHVWKTGRDDVWGPDEIGQHITDVNKWPIKVWDASIEIEIYTREVANAEKRTMNGWSRKK